MRVDSIRIFSNESNFQNIVALPYASDPHQKCLAVCILHQRKRIRKQKPEDGTACRTERQLYASHNRQNQSNRQQPAAEKQIRQFLARLQQHPD